MSLWNGTVAILWYFHRTKEKLGLFVSPWNIRCWKCFLFSADNFIISQFLSDFRIVHLFMIQFLWLIVQVYLPMNKDLLFTRLFVYLVGGSLVCCESCPATFHTECLPDSQKPSTSEGVWYCNDCRHGIRPRYGEIVWVKLGAYRSVLLVVSFWYLS